MAMVDVGHVAGYTGGLNAQVRLARSEGRRLPGALTYIRQDKPGELSQWL